MKNKTKVITIITTVFLSILILLSYVIKPPEKKASAEEITYQYNGSNFSVPVYVGGGNGIYQAQTYNITNSFYSSNYGGKKQFFFKYGKETRTNWNGIWLSNCEVITTQNNTTTNFNSLRTMQYTNGALSAQLINGAEFFISEKSIGCYIQPFGSTVYYRQQEQQEYPTMNSTYNFFVNVLIEVSANFNCNPQSVTIEKVENPNEYIQYGAQFTYYDSNAEYVKIIYSLESAITTNLKRIRLDKRTYYFNQEAQNSFNAGYEEGLKANNTNAYNQGYQKGLQDGDNNEWLQLFSAVVDVPINAFFGKYNSETHVREGGLFNLEIFGYNMANVASAILTISIAIVVIRLVFARRS